MDRAENILFLLNSSPNIWRAMEEFHFRLAKALVERGAKVVIVLAKEVPPDIQARFEASGATIEYLAYRDKWKFFWGIRKLIRKHAITLVHIRFFRLNQFVSWLVYLAGVRTIIYTDAESNESSARGLKRLLKRLRTRIITAPNSRMIAISKFVKGRLIESGVRESKIAVVYNGVDLSRFTPDPQGRARLAAQCGLEPDEIVLTTISRLVDVKHVDVILQACAILQSRGLKFRLLIAGQGGPLEGELKQLSATLGLADRVVWVGATDKPEELLQGTDIFVLASTGEAFGNVLVEAMACGVPIVASRSGAIPEIVIDGEGGYLVEANDLEAFADRIVKISENVHSYADLSVSARHLLSHHDVTSAVLRTLNVYDCLNVAGRQPYRPRRS